MTIRYCWSYPKEYQFGAPILVNNIKMIIPMIQPKYKYTARSLSKMAEDYYINEFGHPPPFLVIAKAPTDDGGIAVGVAYLEYKPTKTI